MSAEFWRLAVLCGMYVCVFFNFCFAETPGEKNRMSGRQGELKVNVVYSSMNFWDRSKTFHRTGPHPTTHIYFWVRGRGRSDQPLLGGPVSALVLCKDRDSFDPELCNTSFEILIKNNLIWVTCLISSFKRTCRTRNKSPTIGDPVDVMRRIRHHWFFFSTFHLRKIGKVSRYLLYQNSALFKCREE